MKEKLNYWQMFWEYQLINSPLMLFGIIAIMFFFSNPWMSIYSISFDWLNALLFTISVTAVLSLTQLLPMFYTFQSKESPRFLKWFYIFLYTIIIPSLTLAYLLTGV